MATKLLREDFNGKYDGASPEILLPPGAISGGKNMRKAGLAGGWKARKGCSKHSTNAIAAHEVKSLHQYTQPKYEDYHFIAQCNGLLYDATNNPPATGVNFGTSLGVNVGSTPGISTNVGDKFVYADGSGLPIVWEGADGDPHCLEVFDGIDAKTDYTLEVTDDSSETWASLPVSTDAYVLLFTSSRCHGFDAELGSAVNTASGSLTVSAWRSGAWVAVSGQSDGTGNWGHDGAVSWTRSVLDEMKEGSGFGYKLSWSDEMSNAVELEKLTVKAQAETITNKWDESFYWPTGAFNYRVWYYSMKFEEILGDIANESTSTKLDIGKHNDDCYLYFKAPEPVRAFGIGIPEDRANSEILNIEEIAYWNGNVWVAVTAIEDETAIAIYDESEVYLGDACLGQSGIISFAAAGLKPKKRTLSIDRSPGYWYRLKWEDGLSSSADIYSVTYAAYPLPLVTCSGVVEFKNRLLLWGEASYPNRLRYSTTGFFDCFSGEDSGWTTGFGGNDKILFACAFYNELLVFKEKSIWLLEGFNDQTFYPLKITDTVGLASISSVQTIEIGYLGMGADSSAVTIAIWQDVDGVYVFDGRKTKKISFFVDNFFNPEKDECIEAADITSLSSFIDKANNEYHLLLPAGELVYNYVTDEWFPLWERAVPLACGLGFRGTDDRNYVYGGSATGYVFRLEDGTADIIGTSEVSISHSIRSRSITLEGKEGILARFNLRRIWAKIKARLSGTVEVKIYKNLSSVGIDQTIPEAMSMISPDEGISVPALDMSLQGCACFAIEFSLETLDEELEIWGFLYELEARGLPNR